MHLHTLVGFCTYLLILIKYGCIYRHWLVSIHDSDKVWMHLQTLVGFRTYLLILLNGEYRHDQSRLSMGHGIGVLV